MRHASKKTAAENRRLAPERREYARYHPCVISGMVATEVHEIHGGAVRHRTKKDKRFWLAVNRIYHDELQYMPKAKQWALKFLHDRENFDVSALSELPGRVTPAEDVLRELKEIL